MCSGTVGSSCSTNINHHVILVGNQVISHERRKARLYLQQTDEECEDTQEGIRIRIRRRTNYSIATIITTKRQTIKP